jgi:hypothetical protein
LMAQKLLSAIPLQSRLWWKFWANQGFTGNSHKNS